jgi:hypothetical protein
VSAPVVGPDLDGDLDGDLDLSLLYSPTEAAARELGISAERILVWHHHRERIGLYPADYSRRGDPQFYEADLRALAAGRPIRDEHRERVTAPADTTR